MVIVFIKAMQVVRGAWVLPALEPPALAAPSPSCHPRRLRNGNKEKPQYALMIVNDLRQLNRLLFYAGAQDSAQGPGVCDEIAIGCGPRRLEWFAGRER